jgi:hypothetical protein
MKYLSTVLLAFAATSGLLQAQILFPTTGSFYDVVLAKVTWDDARLLAESSFFDGRQGLLATITSQEENDFITSVVIGGAGDSFWLGGYQPEGPNVAADEGWEWITGELWDFTNWRRAGGDADEPNDFSGGEHSLEIFNNAYGVYSGTWNDLAAENIGLSEGYVIEYAMIPEPCSVAFLTLGLPALVMARRSRKPLTILSSA